MVSLRNVRNSLLPVRVAYVWAVVFIAMVFYAFAWFVNIWWLWKVIEAMEASFTFEPPLDNVVTIIKWVLVLHPLFAMFGWLLWGFINSMRRDVRTYEY